MAGGGPHNVLIVANGRSAESVAVANAYRDARGVPERNLCLVDLPTEGFRGRSVISGDVYEKAIREPLKAFIREHPAGDRLHFVVLCPDLPLRVDCGGAMKTRSMAALLAGLASDGLIQKIVNPYLGRREAFERFAATIAADERPRLVTWLRGYEPRDALELVRRSVASDATAPQGTFYFVQSPHVMKFDEAVRQLQSRGIAAQVFETDKPVNGADDVAGYFSGGAYSGLKWKDVSSNTYRPGALVDMLQSYGAIWNNWRTFGYNMQTPVAWLIRCGATGVHGTTDEPFADSFPTSGYLDVLLDNYLAGCNLAEAYWSGIRYIGWQNAVFGDPLCAPYARRAKVTCRVTMPVADSPRRVPIVEFDIAMPEGKTLGEVRCFVDDRPAGTLAASDLTVGDDGRLSGSFTPDVTAPADAWRRVRVVAVDASPAAVQGWAVVDVPCGHSERLVLARAASSPNAALAAGDAVDLTAAMTPADSTAVIDLFAGDRRLGRFAGGRLRLDTSPLGPGRHTLQARAADAQGTPLAHSNFLSLELADPIHVVDYWPRGTLGNRPLMYLVYDRLPDPAGAAAAVQARFVQSGRPPVPATTRPAGQVLAVEAASPLKPGVPCRLEVRLSSVARPSRDFLLEFTPSDDPRLLAGLSGELEYRNTVKGLTSSSASGIAPIYKRPALVVLGPVDLFGERQAALASLGAYTVSGQIHVAAEVAKDGNGAGLGVHYSDNRNYCFVRLRSADMVVVQMLAGKQTTLQTWPLPTAAATPFDLKLTVQGPQLTVTLGGQELGSVMLDRSLPPGLPMIDLGAPTGVKAMQVTVRRPQ
jgi:uncharacterized protein (TIGR03790 family)